MGKTLQLATPEWSLPLLNPSRYKGAWGGRGSGKSHMFAELMIEENGGGAMVVREFPADRKKIDIGDYFADDRKIARMLGWKPRTDLRTALARTLDYYRRERRFYV